MMDCSDRRASVNVTYLYLGGRGLKDVFKLGMDSVTSSRAQMEAELLIRWALAALSEFSKCYY